MDWGNNSLLLRKIKRIEGCNKKSQIFKIVKWIEEIDL